MEKEASPDLNWVGVGKQVLSPFFYVFRKILQNRWTIQRPFSFSCSLVFQRSHLLLAVDNFGPNICSKILSLLKSREFCHLFQQAIGSLIFILCFWINIAPRLGNVFRFTHSHEYTHKWKRQRKKPFQVPQLLLIFSALVLYINFIFNKISILYLLQNGYQGKTHAI